MQQPKHLLIFKIVGIVGILLAVVGIFLSVTGFGNFDNNHFMIGGICTSVGLFVGVSCLCVGFLPEITKLHTKTAKYIQEENQDDLKEIANLSADISKEAITKTAKAVKDGFDDCVFCKSCGKAIDSDSKFCRYCGKEQ